MQILVGFMIIVLLLFILAVLIFVHTKPRNIKQASFQKGWNETKPIIPWWLTILLIPVMIYLGMLLRGQ